VPQTTPTVSSLPSGIITTMFTDIVDSTRIKGLMEGETSARRDLSFRVTIKEPHDAVVLACVREAGGYVVNPTGDGFCTTFVDAEEAVLCALRIQRHLEAHPIATPLGDLQIRIGLHTGIAGPSGDDYIASTVDKTARVQGKAGGGEVFVSQQTQVLVSDRTQGVRFEPRGTFDLKGLQSEELYQALPGPNLVLPSVTAEALADRSIPKPALESNEPRQQMGITRERDTRSNKSKIGILIAGITLFCFAGIIFLRSRPAVDAIFPVGSQWDGSFRFLPPMGNYDGSVSIEVTKRDGEGFEAIYSSEDRKYQWLVHGTVRGTVLKWTFTKAIKNPGSEDAVGKAYCDATITGDRMQGTFRMSTDRNEVAELDLRATKR
jgi:class 3 adenylate cyclase